MATYAIGDIQGCFASFMHLLSVCGFDRREDRLWLVGDLVNRGPRSLETLRFIRELGDAAVVVLGNHDLYLLMVAEGGARFRARDDTLQAVLEAPDAPELFAWLRQQKLCHAEGNFLMVHAGLLPQWSATQAVALSGEVEAALRGPDYGEFMRNLWGSEPAIWADDLAGWPRLRVVVNAMTRMRFCTAGGEMEFRSKGETADAPSGYLPWFEAPARQTADQVVVCGHWSALGLRMTPGLLALDSGCLWGGQLTAVRLEDGVVFQVPPAAGESRPLIA